jgi:hypothetical protein
MSWFFSRKVKNTRSPERIANQMALASVQKKYGRVAQHSKVANVMRPNEGYHDPFAIERKQLAQKFLDKAPKKAASFTSEEKQGLIDWVKELKQAAKENQNRGFSGGGSISTNVPTAIVTILCFIVGIGLLAISIGAVFLDIAGAFAGGSSFLSMALFSESLNIMGFSERPSNNSKYVGTNNPMYSARTRKNRRNRKN